MKCFEFNIIISANKGASGRPLLRSYSEGQSQIQLELAEHENQVLRSKMSKVERDAEEMASKINLLEKQVSSKGALSALHTSFVVQVSRAGGRTTFSERELAAAVPDTYYKQKIKMLEEELDEARHKIEEARRAELEATHQLRVGILLFLPVVVSAFCTPLESVFQQAEYKMGERRKRGAMARSQSLDESGNEDASTPSTARSVRASSSEKDTRHALLEQEMHMLRKRGTVLEQDNQRLTEENKRLKVMQVNVARAYCAAGRCCFRVG